MDLKKITSQIGSFENTFSDPSLTNGCKRLFSFNVEKEGSSKEYGIYVTNDVENVTWARPPESIFIDGFHTLLLGDEDYHLQALGFDVDGTESTINQLQRTSTQYVKDVEERLEGFDYVKLLFETLKTCCEKSGVKEIFYPSATQICNYPPALLLQTQTRKMISDDEVDGCYREYLRENNVDIPESRIKRDVRRILSARKGFRKTYDENAIRLGFNPKIFYNGRIMYYSLEL